MTQNTENPTPTVYQAILAVAKQIGVLQKDGYNQNQNYKFLGIDQITDALQPALIEHGVTIIPRVVQYESQDREWKEKIARFCTVLVEYTITGPAGDSVKAVVVGEANDSLDKAMNKALASAAKYFLKQTFWLATGDPDPDSEGTDQNQGGNSAGGAGRSGRSSGGSSGAKAGGRPATATQPAAPNNAGAITDNMIDVITGLSEGQNVLDVAAGATGRPITNLNELTFAEGKALITQLRGN